MTPLSKKQQWVRFIISLLVVEAHYGLIMWYMMTHDPHGLESYIFVVLAMVSMVFVWAWLFKFNHKEITMRKPQS